MYLNKDKGCPEEHKCQSEKVKEGPFVTFKVTPNFKKNVRLLNVRINQNSYQNWLLERKQLKGLCVTNRDLI